MKPVILMRGRVTSNQLGPFHLDLLRSTDGDLKKLEVICNTGGHHICPESIGDLISELEKIKLELESN